MFWLTRYITKSYWAAILAGYIFTFSHYHYAYARAQLELASYQCLPVYIYFILKLIKEYKKKDAILAALCLWIILNIAYYQFFFCILMTGIIGWYYIWKEKKLFFLINGRWRVWLLFSGLVLITCGLQVRQLNISNHNDPIIGAHLPQDWELDTFGLIIPGKYWRFNQTTYRFWKEIEGQLNENGTYIGIGALMLASINLIKQSKKGKDKQLWMILLVIASILSMGPWLQVWGHFIKPYELILPYGWLVKILPILKLSGVPIRMVIISVFSISILAAFGFQRLIGMKHKYAKVVLVVLLIIVAIDSLPSKLAETRLEIPDYVNYLRLANNKGSVLDLINDNSRQLYHQTIHQKPVVFGSLARVNNSTWQVKEAKEKAITDNDFWTLRNSFKVAYVVTDKEINGLKKVFQAKDNIYVYDLINSEYQ